jgi:L-ascorbate metabolism protein UlaG (beta-lactamase superfamily)
MKWFIAAGGTAAAGAAFVLPRKANAYYAGPVSDHFDGVAFFNPGGRKPKGFNHVLKLYALETWSTWPSVLPSPLRDKPPVRVTGSAARLAFVGHASWLIQSGGLNILVDPHWSDRASPVSFAGPRRANLPGIDFDDLPPIDVVLVTHNHYDHLDIPTLARLWARNRPRIITPLGNDTIMRQAIHGIVAEAVDWGHVIELQPGGVRVFVEPSQHWSARGMRDRRHALWASFVLETPAGAIYAIGDTGLGDGNIFRGIRERHPAIRLALLPIGAYEPRWFMESQHMNPSDSVEAFLTVGAQQACGHHWGTFQLTTEPHDAPPKALDAALAARNIAPERFRPVQPGAVLTI